jgi:protein-S-isoprenylcysteine O-methyltransferase Ste14
MTPVTDVPAEETQEPELSPYPCNLCGTPQKETKLDRSPEVSRLSRHSYLAGLAGMLAVIGGGYLAARRNMLDHGWGIGSGEHDVHKSMALVLLVCSAVMFLVELAIRLDVDRGRIVKVDPDLKEGRAGRFILLYALDRVSPAIVEQIGALVPGGLGPKRPFDKYDRYAILGLCVKGFWVPLMTVFFADQFTSLINNISWMRGPNSSLATISLRDVHNVSHAFIFAVDVGLAWCGYVVSSRWIKNTVFSAEPTFVGWFVALACYPPHNRLLGVYFGQPGEDAFFQIPNPRVVMFFAILSILSYCVYTSATVVFGLRFSNLTHRGVITTGPYAYIRHPAYASKNFSWWCVMLPFVLWQIYNNHEHDPAHTWQPALQILGMFLMSFVYYWRAITEERHLSRDPEYRKYMQKVPYRFIPGVL